MTARIGRSSRVQMRQRALAAGQRAELWPRSICGSRAIAFSPVRYCVRGGEIDLIARAGSTIAFIEVKYRPTLLQAMTAIDGAKHRRVSRAAAHWLAANPWAARLTLRGDAVYLAPRHWPRHAIAAMSLALD